MPTEPPRQTPLEQIVRMMMQALETGRIVKLGDDGDPMVLCYRNRGQEIDDPECEDLFEALEAGVFLRARSVTFQDGQEQATGHRWLRWCGLEHAQMVAALGPRIDALPHVEREGVALNAAWLVIQHEDSQQTLRRRAEAQAKRVQDARVRGY